MVRTGPWISRKLTNSKEFRLGQLAQIARANPAL